MYQDRKPKLRGGLTESIDVPNGQKQTCYVPGDGRLLHSSANSFTNSNTLGIKVLQTEYINPEIVRRNTLSMERVDPTNIAKVMLGCIAVKLISS